MHRIAIAALLGVFIASPAWAQSEIVITQAKALAGNVTPGDTAGYPITLSQPGAYVLGSNLTVPNGQYGIFAGADNIDIDLSGYVITGGGVGTYGIISNRGQGHIHGGAIKLFSASGIYLRGDAWKIENMTIVQNGGYGVDAIDTLLLNIQNSLVAVNRRVGVETGDLGFFKGNQIVNNGSDGIYCKYSCHVEGNFIAINKSSGIIIGQGLVIGNTFMRNSQWGLFDNGGDNNTGYTNNMFVENNPFGREQVVGAIVDPNRCAGATPCTNP